MALDRRIAAAHGPAAARGGPDAPVVASAVSFDPEPTLFSTKARTVKLVAGYTPIRWLLRFDFSAHTSPSIPPIGGRGSTQRGGAAMPASK
jgi:hypothetical protein